MRVFAVLTAAALAAAQEPVIRVDVDIVNVLATVRTKAGGVAGKLEKSDFTVLEDGKPQEIKYFARETDTPLTIGLLVDTSKSQERLIETERLAAAAFFKKLLRPKDMAFLMQFGAEAELLEDSTNSARQLEKALGELRLSVPVGGLHPGPVPTAQNRAGTVLYDAVYLAAQEKLKGEVGRKVIVVISDGVDTGSKMSRAKAIEAAHKADAVIYAIYYADPMYRMMTGSGEGDLKKMAEETGGRVFTVGRNLPLEAVFREIDEDMRAQYSLGYTPANPNKDGGFRKLEVRTANKDYRVYARKGYFATASPDPQ
jgi:VWFA-related protein